MATRCFKVVGLDRDGGRCECCGRDNLKKLVILREVTEEGEGDVLRFGSACAAKAVNFSWSAASIETAGKNANLHPMFAKVIGKRVDSSRSAVFMGPW